MKNKQIVEQKLKSAVQKDVERLEKAKKERRTLLAPTVYLGTLGLMLVLPIIAGAYLGNWLDDRLDTQSGGYSVSWTVTLILLGVFVGSVNVYIFIKRNE